MSDFERALPIIAKHEGDSYTDDPHDPGGPTKCGITLAWLQEHHLDIDHDGDVDVDDIRALTWELAAPRYKAEIWDALGIGRVVDQQLATKLFDLSVNLGPTRAIRYFQRALNLSHFTLAEDGELGPITLQALNACSPREVLLEVSSIQASHYRAWCAEKNCRERYLAGLLRRAAWPYVARAAAGVA
jgi:lysozyme family protein